MPKQAPLHRPQAPRKGQLHQKNRQNTRAMHTGSKAWRQLRLQVLTEDLFTCAKCGKFGDQVDHKDGNAHNNARHNLQVLCLADHSSKTMSEQNEKRSGKGPTREGGNAKP